MKVVILGPAHPYRGGIADTNEELCRALNKDGHDCSIFTFKMQYPSFLFPGKTQFSTENAPEDIRTTREIHSLNPFNWIRVGLKLKKIKPDLVVIRYWIPFLSPCLGTIARFIGKKTKTIGLCDNVIPHEKRFGDSLLTKYFVGGCNGFITMSNTVKADLRKFTQKPTIYTPHPIIGNLGDLLDKSKAKSILGLDKDTNYLLFFGLVRDYKGLDILLQSLTKTKTNCSLIVAGEFYGSKEKYENYIALNNLNKRVILVDSFIPKKEIQNYFSACDMLTLTYKTATQSGVTQIGFYFNKPMLVTDVGGLSEIIAHNKMGYVCQKDEAEIANAIDDFYSQNREEAFTQAVIKEKSKYSWSEFLTRLSELHSKI